MKNLIIAISFIIFSLSSYANGVKLFNNNFLPTGSQIEVVLNKVELDAGINDNNTFYFGDDDFEMFLTLDGVRQLNFPLAANNSNKPKVVDLSHRVRINVEDVNSAINKRLDSSEMSDSEKFSIQLSRVGQLCMLDDSLIAPSFLSTSYYGCLDLAARLQEMISKGISEKEFLVEENTVYPATKDPSKAKMFKSWYTVKLR